MHQTLRPSFDQFNLNQYLNFFCGQFKVKGLAVKFVIN